MGKLLLACYLKKSAPKPIAFNIGFFLFCPVDRKDLDEAKYVR